MRQIDVHLEICALFALPDQQSLTWDPISRHLVFDGLIGVSLVELVNPRGMQFLLNPSGWKTLTFSNPCFVDSLDRLPHFCLTESVGGSGFESVRFPISALRLIYHVSLNSPIALLKCPPC